MFEEFFYYLSRNHFWRTNCEPNIDGVTMYICVDVLQRFGIPPTLFVWTCTYEILICYRGWKWQGKEIKLAALREGQRKFYEASETNFTWGRQNCYDGLFLKLMQSHEQWEQNILKVNRLFELSLHVSKNAAIVYFS